MYYFNKFKKLKINTKLRQILLILVNKYSRYYTLFIIRNDPGDAKGRGIIPRTVYKSDG